MVTVEIIVVGNEVLLGQVQDTNSSYLCRMVRERGGLVRHIAVVRDEIDAISDALKASLIRRAGLILSCGGLGPTDDDLTLAGIARATGRELELNQTARDIIERRYTGLASDGFVESSEMNDARLKMARLPEGALAVENPVGSAPGVTLEAGGARIVALPGVPAELKAIVEGPLQALISETFGSAGYCEREIIVNCGDESQLAPVLRDVAAANPQVYVKSRASHFGQDVRFRVVVSAAASSAQDAQRLIETAAEDLIRGLRRAGFDG
ncbi:MAG TPA: molybdopterin-binding protein [Blastocatellia bacterium]|nr:molybdopterin-binding protein [Blastocatellia bacterium]